LVKLFIDYLFPYPFPHPDVAPVSVFALVQGDVRVLLDYEIGGGRNFIASEQAYYLSDD
jgi:hypothetical protein